HLFKFDRAATPREEATLEGLDSRIQSRVAEARRQWDHEQLAADHARLREDYKSLEQYTDRIEEELAGHRSRKLHLGNIDLLELGGQVLEGFIRRNPKVLSRLPGGEALAGAIIADNGERETQHALPESQGQATISRVDSTGSEEDRHYVELLRQIQTSFTQEE